LPEKLLDMHMHAMHRSQMTPHCSNHPLQRAIAEAGGNGPAEGLAPAAAGPTNRNEPASESASSIADVRPRLRNPFAPIEEEEPPEIRRPQEPQFWLKDAEGRYLNRYCTGMTSDHRRAWTGTVGQAAGCRATFVCARGLRQTAVDTRGLLR
jgi:hypothetical protein